MARQLSAPTPALPRPPSQPPPPTTQAPFSGGQPEARACGARSFLASIIVPSHRRCSALTPRCSEEACEWLFISHYLYQRYWCPSIIPMVLLALSVPLYSVGSSSKVTLSKRQQVSYRCGSWQPCLSVKAPQNVNGGGPPPRAGNHFSIGRSREPGARSQKPGARSRKPGARGVIKKMFIGNRVFIGIVF